MLKLKLAAKTSIFLILICSATGFSVGLISYMDSKRSIESITYDRLIAIQSEKSSEISRYFEQIIHQIQTLSENPTTIAALDAFSEAYADLDNEQTASQWSGPESPLRQFYREEFLPHLNHEEGSGSKRLDTQTNALLPKGNAGAYLQHHYLAVNPHPSGAKAKLVRSDSDLSSYGRAHAQYHEFFRSYQEKFDYYDLFLVDITSGQIVYSVFKESDFGTSLLTGPYRSSNIAQAFAMASGSSDPDATHFADYQPYLPSYNAPAAFFASPIFQGDEAVGVLILQIPIDQINRVMTGDQQWSEHGLGNSGETYLVGSDYTMRSDSRFFLEDPEAYLQTLDTLNYPQQKISQLRRFQTSILNQGVNTDSVLYALAGDSGAHVVEDYRKVPVLSAYGPVDIGDERWAVLAEIDANEAFAPITDLQRSVSISTLLITLVLVVVGIAVSRSLTRPIAALTQAAQAVGAGKVIEPLTQNSQDELGELTRQFNQMTSNLYQQRQTIDKQTQENYQLLLNVLPEPIANRLKNGEAKIADAFPSVSVLFADIVGFTAMSRDVPPITVLRMLDDLFGAFDQAALDCGVEKIKTIGDSYMAVCGMPEPNQHHADHIAELALEIIRCLKDFNERNGTHLSMRIGAHSGAVVAGVVGSSKFIYDLWGDTVNMASRMESTGMPDHLQVSESFRDHLTKDFNIAFRGELQVKGIGPVNTYLISAHPLER